MCVAFVPQDCVHSQVLFKIDFQKNTAVHVTLKNILTALDLEYVHFAQVTREFLSRHCLTLLQV